MRLDSNYFRVDPSTLWDLQLDPRMFRIRLPICYLDVYLFKNKGLKTNVVFNVERVILSRD